MRGWAGPSEMQFIWSQDKSTLPPSLSPSAQGLAIAKVLNQLFYVYFCFLACQEAGSMLLTGEYELSAEAKGNRK